MNRPPLRRSSAVAGQELKMYGLTGMSGRIRFDHPEASLRIAITGRQRSIIGRAVFGVGLEKLDDVLQLVPNRLDGLVRRPPL